jgi:hypothetical protein
LPPEGERDQYGHSCKANHTRNHETACATDHKPEQGAENLPAIEADAGPSGKLGHWRIVGIPEEACLQFSKRSAEIDAKHAQLLSAFMTALPLVASRVLISVNRRKHIQFTERRSEKQVLPMRTRFSVAITLGFFPVTLIMRLVRSEMLEVLRTDYIKFARARGLPDRAIHFGHALKNTLVPVMTIIGLQLGTLIAFVAVQSGSIWPGLVFHATHNSLAWLHSLGSADLGALEKTQPTLAWIGGNAKGLDEFLKFEHPDALHPGRRWREDLCRNQQSSCFRAKNMVKEPPPSPEL